MGPSSNSSVNYHAAGTNYLKAVLPTIEYKLTK